MAACVDLPSPGRDAEGDSPFRESLDGFVAKYCDMWRRTAMEIPVLPESFDRPRQRRNERATDRLIDAMEEEIHSFPRVERERPAWRDRIRDSLRRYGTDCLGFPPRYLDTLFSKEYVDVTGQFIRSAHEFDETLEIDTLFQALRNVWIMNSIQMFLGAKPAFSPSIFAYSMLYPYTDNFLDDPAIPADVKQRMNDRLGKRLKGIPVEAGSPHEEDVFRLIGMIEGEHDRLKRPDVYCSLAAIHQAQVRSLVQHRKVCLPTLPAVLEISVAKGGASVLTDAYLVAGDLERDEADFFFGYGVFLQLLDDLQDVRQDLEHGHSTIFTLGSSVESLDRSAARLCRFVERVLTSSARFGSEPLEDLKDIIRRNCNFLLLQAIAHNHEFYGKKFKQNMEQFSPASFGYLRRSRKSLEKRYVKIKRKFGEKSNLQSLIEVLG